MPVRTKVYFLADVHLGLKAADPGERERRLISFLESLPEDTLSLYLLGDIWDFWYEYRDVVPREGAKVVAALVALMNRGVEVWFIPGNHDIWTFSYFESLGIHRCEQPLETRIGGKRFCLGHGDRLGGGRKAYGLMLKVFHSKLAQAMFSTLHPWLAYRMALAWSGSNRAHHKPYHFKGESEPLYKFALERDADFFIFGHYHDGMDAVLATGARFVILQDWIRGGTPHACFDTVSGELSVVSSQASS